MVTGYSNYHVELRNVKFIADDGRTCPRTAMVTFHNEEGEEVDSELFGAIDINHIYAIIKEGRDLILDNFYIHAFSISSYRRINGIEKKELVPLKGFSAKNAFFEAKGCTDFTYASFSQEEVSFDGSHFARARFSSMARFLAMEMLFFQIPYSGMGTLNLQVVFLGW